jgi:hypothetical protein
MIIYIILKAQGDILVQFDEFDLAIKAYKRVKDVCERRIYSPNMKRLKMRLYEQIAVCYKT